MCGARVDDPSGERLADAGQLNELGPGSLVDVDLKSRLEGIGAVDLDQPSAMSSVV